MTPDDAQAYRKATADFLNDLGKSTRWLPEAERTAWKRAEMSQFRDEWLISFRNNRDY
jgi:hypothetical protein